MNRYNYFSREIVGILGCVLVYILILSTGAVGIANAVISILPVTILVASVYIFLCGNFGHAKNNFVCRLSKFSQSHSGNLTIWLALSFLLIGCQLALVWGGEALSFFYMGGLLPNGDGSSYYKGARRLLLEGDLSEWSSRRPFMTVYLASILAISKLSLSSAIAMVSAIAAFSIALFASTLRRSESLGVVLWAFVLVFFFYYRLIGNPLSEHLGLTFGCMAFVFLWVAANERSISYFVIGVLFMTMAQVTRSGAVFVLPALVIWGSFWLASGVRTRLLVFSYGCIAIVAGFLLNRLLMEMGGAGSQAGFSNFSDTVYGLSVGEGGWSQIAKDYPEIHTLTEPERSQRIYSLALNNIINEPLRLFKALFRNLYLFAFANGGLNIVTGSKAWLLVQIPTLLGVVWCIRNFRVPRYAMLLFVLAGILVSSTIIAEDGGLRVFAATVPFSAAIAAVGLPISMRLQGAGSLTSGVRYNTPVLAALITGAVLLSGIFYTVAIAPTESQAVSGEKVTCRPGARQITIVYPARTAIHLRQNEEDYTRYVPNFPENDFREALVHNGSRRDWPKVELLQIPYSMIAVGKYILLPTSLISDDPDKITVCTEKKGWLFIDQRLLKNSL